MGREERVAYMVKTIIMLGPILQVRVKDGCRVLKMDVHYSTISESLRKSNISWFKTSDVRLVSLLHFRVWKMQHISFLLPPHLRGHAIFIHNCQAKWPMPSILELLSIFTEMELIKLEILWTGKQGNPLWQPLQKTLQLFLFSLQHMMLP